MSHNRVAVCASRQIGKSVAIAVLTLSWALTFPNQTVLIISTGERQVKELLTKRNYSIKKIFKRQERDHSELYAYQPGENVSPTSLIKAFASEAEVPYEHRAGLKLEYGLKHQNSEEVEFNNGSRIVVVPANPDTASGYTANLLVGDEIAKMPNWPDMQSACFPFVSRVYHCPLCGNMFDYPNKCKKHPEFDPFFGKIALFSSFKGKNHWYDITQNSLSEQNPKGWKVLFYPVTVNPPPDLEQLKHDLPVDTFYEEYMCVPMDSAHSFFPYSLIDSCATGSFEEWE